MEGCRGGVDVREEVRGVELVNTSDEDNGSGVEDITIPTVELEVITKDEVISVADIGILVSVLEIGISIIVVVSMGTIRDVEVGWD